MRVQARRHPAPMHGALPTHLLFNRNFVNAVTVGAFVHTLRHLMQTRVAATPATTRIRVKAA